MQTPIAFKKALEHGVDVVEVDGRPFMFVPGRISKNYGLPLKYYIYDVEADPRYPNEFGSVSIFKPNPVGTLIGKKPLRFTDGSNDYICGGSDGTLLFRGITSLKDYEAIVM